MKIEMDQTDQTDQTMVLPVGKLHFGGQTLIQNFLEPVFQCHRDNTVKTNRETEHEKHLISWYSIKFSLELAPLSICCGIFWK